MILPMAGTAMVEMAAVIDMWFGTECRRHL